MLNHLSLLCLWAISRMVQGCTSSYAVASDPSACSHEGPPVEQTLNRLVTPHIARKLASLGTLQPPIPVANIDQLLESDFLEVTSESGATLRRLAKLLTTNSATPCFIWDNKCRAEIMCLLDEQVDGIVKKVCSSTKYPSLHPSYTW